MNQVLFLFLAYWAFSPFWNIHAQNLTKTPIQQLDFLVGNWVGTSSKVEKGIRVKEYPAYEEIAFDLDSSILVIKLFSEPLRLHTIIQYSKADSCYYYHPFYKNGSAKYPAYLKDGKLVVNANETRRFIFSVDEGGEFREYGEKLEGGKWLIYFDDRFRAAP